MEEVKMLRIGAIVVGIAALLFIVIGLFSPAWFILQVQAPTDPNGVTGGGSLSVGLFSTVACVDMQGAGDTCVSMSLDDMAKVMPPGSLSPEEKPLYEAGFTLLRGYISPLQVLMILGLVFAIAAFVLLCLYTRQMNTYEPKQKNFGTFCCIAWAVASICILTAVAAQGYQNTNVSLAVDTLSLFMKTAQDKANDEMKKLTTPTTTSERFDMSGFDSGPYGGSGYDPSKYGAMMPDMVLQNQPNPFQGIEISVNSPWAVVLSGIGGCLCLLLQLVTGLWLCRRNENSAEWHEFSNQQAQP